jgi:hypothetical protein
MKNLIYFFLLFSTVVSSQNYNYAIDEPQKTAKPATPVVNNQLEEIEYFKAYLLPIAQKANLQKALDTYGAVRLEKGDYRGADIIIGSNQKLYGHPSLTKVSNITITAGSTGIVLEDLNPQDKTITIQSGGVISGCTFKSLKEVKLIGTNIQFENNTLIDYDGQIQFDCSVSGYFRNNKIIRHKVGTVSNMLVLKGNSTTPSYGNVHLWSNYLTPHGDTTDIDNLQSATFVGIDCEGWNLLSEGTKAMFSAHNMGNVKITDMQGGSYNPNPNIAYNVDATNLFFLNQQLQTVDDIVSAKTNVFRVAGNGTFSRSAETVTGFNLLAMPHNTDVIYNGVSQTATISDLTTITKLSNAILGTHDTPWTRPTSETLPDPLGVNWSTDRVGKPDSRAYIQNLINTNNIAELPEGIFYISSTLLLPADRLHGIIGKGTGKTVICGLTDKFPLISIGAGGDGAFTLSNITLQGGNAGIYASMNYGNLNIAYQKMKFVVFRNQNYGIHLYQTGGFDNCFMENLGFVNCNIGFFQDPLRSDSGENNSAYVDKTLFYKNQYINCNEAVSMRATRADNLDAWVDCKFDNNRIALNTGGLSSAIAANCDFTNTTGSAPSGSMGNYTYKENCVINGNFSLYSCNFNNNSTAYMFNAQSLTMEGCNLLDNITVFANGENNGQWHNIINSTITGAMGGGAVENSGVYINSNFIAHPSYSKLFVNINLNVPTVLINTTPTPYPQLLVTQ